MKHILFKSVFIIFAVFCIACSSGEKLNISAQDYYMNSQNEIRKYEWTSFDVACTEFDGKKITSQDTFCHVIIRNKPDSAQCVAILTPFYSLLFDFDSATYVNDEFAELATISNKCVTNGYNLFYMQVANVMQHIEFNPAYSSIIEYFSHTKVSDTSKFITKKNGYYKIKGYVTQKICTSKSCYLVDTPIDYFFNANTGILDSAIETRGWQRRSEHFINISHSNCQNIIDSIFDIHAERYKNYSLQINDSLGIYSEFSVSNTEMNKSVLNYPLINVHTYDTTTLDKFNGWTLLCILPSFSYDSSYIKSITEKDLPVDNIVFVMPYSDNLVYIKPWAKSLPTSEQIFYTKKIGNVLGLGNKSYLISPQKETVWYDRFLYNISRITLLKAKADYEKQHNLKP